MDYGRLDTYFCRTTQERLEELEGKERVCLIIDMETHSMIIKKLTCKKLLNGGYCWCNIHKVSEVFDNFWTHKHFNTTQLVIGESNIFKDEAEYWKQKESLWGKM